MTEFLTVYLFCALGVAASVLLPILRAALPQPATGRMAKESALSRIVAAAKPYVVLALFSLVVALLLVAFLKEQLTDWRAAVLAGYAADSTLQKLKG